MFEPHRLVLINATIASGCIDCTGRPNCKFAEFGTETYMLKKNKNKEKYLALMKKKSWCLFGIQFKCTIMKYSSFENKLISILFNYSLYSKNS